MITNHLLNPRYKRIVMGEDIDDRYSLVIKERYIDYDTERLYNPMFPELFENPKLLFRKISGTKASDSIL